MSHRTLLARSASRILAFIDQQISEAEPDHSDEIISTLYSLHRIFPQWLIMTCPTQHKNFLYISNNCQEITGHDPAYLQQRQPENMIRLIHESDMPHLQTCYAYCESIIRNELPGTHLHIRTIFHYRLQHAEGHYLHVYDEKASFQLSNGSTIFFSMMRDISQEKAFAGVQVEVFKQDHSLVKIGACHPAKTSRKLSPREQDLIVLIRQGLTTKEIAGQLKISHHTVRNIRSKMFEKYQVNNVVELLNRTYTPTLDNSPMIPGTLPPGYRKSVP